MDRKKRISYIGVMLAITLACAPVLPSVAIPTIGPGAVDTIVAATSGAAATQTARFAPTSTSTPTTTPTASNTPTQTAVPTNTIIFRISTLTPVKLATATKKATSTSTGGGGGGTADYKCSVISVTPANNSNIPANTNFTAKWKVKNTGSIKWDENSIDYLYVSGKTMHLQSVYDLPATVNVGATITLPVNMQAPASSGTYSSTWNLRVGSDKFCSMKITIKVP